MADLPTILRNLPAAGARLPGGLALRISRGNGMVVLGCSRVGVAPSETEMEVVLDAVVSAFAPAVVFQATEPEYRAVGGYDHYIWRLYWPAERVQVAWQPATQGELLSGANEF